MTALYCVQRATTCHNVHLKLESLLQFPRVLTSVQAAGRLGCEFFISHHDSETYISSPLDSYLWWAFAKLSEASFVAGENVRQEVHKLAVNELTRSLEELRRNFCTSSAHSQAVIKSTSTFCRNFCLERSQTCSEIWGKSFKIVLVFLDLGSQNLYSDYNEPHWTS